jgi:hypothetical protein
VKNNLARNNSREGIGLRLVPSFYFCKAKGPDPLALFDTEPRDLTPWLFFCNKEKRRVPGAIIIPIRGILLISKRQKGEHFCFGY